MIFFGTSIKSYTVSQCYSLPQRQLKDFLFSMFKSYKKVYTGLSGNMVVPLVCY